MCIVQQSESYTAYDLPSSLLAFSVSSGMDFLVADRCTRSMCVHVYLALRPIPPDGRLIRYQIQILAYSPPVYLME